MSDLLGLKPLSQFGLLDTAMADVPFLPPLQFLTAAPGREPVPAQEEMFVMCKSDPGPFQQAHITLRLPLVPASDSNL